MKSSGKGIVVLLSDMMDKDGYEERPALSRRPAIRHLRYPDPVRRKKWSRTLLGDLKLVDIEDDDEAEITVSGPLIERYKQNLAAFQAGRCRNSAFAAESPICSTSNQVPFERLVLSYLRQRGLVR